MIMSAEDMDVAGERVIGSAVKEEGVEGVVRIFKDFLFT